MTDVIFKENPTPEQEKPENLFQQKEEVDTEKISEQWLKAVQNLTDHFQYKVFNNVRQYTNSQRVDHDNPTTHELCEYMEQSYATIQPRTSELKEAMVLVEAGKRPCTCQRCVQGREEQGKPELSVTTWKIRQVTK